METQTADLLSKSQFAVHIGRSAARVSQLIKDGKISGAALVPTDKGERINVGVAMQQLADSLDISQQAAQAHPIAPRGRDGELPLAGAASSATAPRAPAQVNDEVARIQSAKALTAEIAAQRAQREEKAQNGEWVERVAVEAKFNGALVSLMSRIESEYLTMGTSVAGDLGTEVRKTTIALRRAFRALRAKMAQEARQRRDELSALADLADDNAAADADDQPAPEASTAAT